MPIEVFFNRPDQPIGIDRLLADIVRARHALCIASAWFTDTVIADAFINSGARAKVMLLNQSDIQRGEKQAFKRVLQWNKGGYNENYDDGLFVLGTGDWQEGVMHHKFVIIDMTIVWVGSYNFTFQARKNYETILRINDPFLAREFWREVEVLRGIAQGLSDPFLEEAALIQCVYCEKYYPEEAIAAAGTGGFAVCAKCYSNHENEHFDGVKDRFDRF